METTTTTVETAARGMADKGTAYITGKFGTLTERFNIELGKFEAHPIRQTIKVVIWLWIVTKITKWFFGGEVVKTVEV